MRIGDDAGRLFLKERPTSFRKLIFLDAANRELDAVTCTCGAHQAFRYKGLGGSQVNKCYDSTFTREVNRPMNHVGGMCGKLGIFVPSNFVMIHSEHRHEAYTAENELWTRAETLVYFGEFVPYGAHDLQHAIHGVPLTDSMRKAGSKEGFPGWG